METTDKYRKEKKNDKLAPLGRNRGIERISQKRKMTHNDFRINNSKLHFVNGAQTSFGKRKVQIWIRHGFFKSCSSGGVNWTKFFSTRVPEKLKKKLVTIQPTNRIREISSTKEIFQENENVFKIRKKSPTKIILSRLVN